MTNVIFCIQLDYFLYNMTNIHNRLNKKL